MVAQSTSRFAAAVAAFLRAEDFPRQRAVTYHGRPLLIVRSPAASLALHLLPTPRCAAEVLPPARARRSYDWYAENQVVIEAAAKRCRELKQAMPASAGRRARSRKAWKAAQRGYRKLLKQCRDKWHLSLMAEANRYDHTSVWKVIQQMKAGRRLTAKVKDQPFEAAEAAKFFTENVFNIRRDGIDAMAVAALRQRALRPGMDAVPTLDELKAALALCKRGKSSSNGVPVEFYQALIHDDEALGLLHAFYAELGKCRRSSRHQT